MSMQKNSLYPQDWKRMAKKDWNRVKIMLKEEDAEAAGVFLQQALERYLNTFLLQKGWKLKKIHELESLLDNALKYNPSLESFRTLCERVSEYYFVERYHILGFSLELTCSDIERDIAEAQQFIYTLFGENL